MNKEGSFTGYIHIDGHALTCKLGFQYLKESSYQTGRESFESHTSSVPTIELPKTEYLCANTCSDSKAALFHFEHKGDGEYIITSRDSNFYPGRYLGVSNNSYIFAYEPRSESNAFRFKKGDKSLTLSDMPSKVTSGLDMVCKGMRLELHKKEEYKPSEGRQWAAYLCTHSGDVGLVGSNFSLVIEDRNVE